MPRRSRPESLKELLDELPAELRRQAFTHASWVEHRAESYERLAFLGDVVLSLAVSTHLFPRFERYGAGRLTKVRAQAVKRTFVRARRAGAQCPRRAAGERPRGHHGPQLGDARRFRARACLGLRGDHRRDLPRVRVRASGAGGGRVLLRGDRPGARASGGLQVGAPGAARPSSRGRGLPHRVRGGAGARPALRGGCRGSPGRSSGAGRERPRRARSRKPRSRRWTGSTPQARRRPPDAFALDPR